MASVYDIVAKAVRTGKVDKGINEVTKAIERGVAKLVVVASDVDNKEIIKHLPILCKEKGVKYVEADSKQKLGGAVGIKVPCSSIAVIEAGDSAREIGSL